MSYETVYGPDFPCPCGGGRVQYTRVEHDSHPARWREWRRAELECELCSEKFVVKGGLGDQFFYVPREEAAGVKWLDVAERGYQRVPPPTW